MPLEKFKCIVMSNDCIFTLEETLDNSGREVVQGSLDDNRKIGRREYMFKPIPPISEQRAQRIVDDMKKFFFERHMSMIENYDYKSDDKSIIYIYKDNQWVSKQSGYYNTIYTYKDKKWVKEHRFDILKELIFEQLISNINSKSKEITITINDKKCVINKNINLLNAISEINCIEYNYDFMNELILFMIWVFKRQSDETLKKLKSKKYECKRKIRITDSNHKLSGGCYEDYFCVGKKGQKKLIFYPFVPSLNSNVCL